MKDPNKAAHRRHHESPPDSGRAFLPDPRDGVRRSAEVDEFAETLAEEYLAAATSGEEICEDVRDEITTEEVGGPFVVLKINDESGASGTEGTARRWDAASSPAAAKVGGKGASKSHRRKA